MPQPNLVPVRPMTSRSTQRRGMSPATSTWRVLPFTVRSMGIPLPERSAWVLVPLANRDYDEHLGLSREMIDVRHPAGGVSREGRQVILVGRDDHDMGTDMEVLVRRLAERGLVRYPGSAVHVGDAYSLDVSRSPRQAILDPLQEDSIEASGLVVRRVGRAGEAGPFRGSLPENAVLAIRRGRPIENGRVLRQEIGAGSLRIRDLLGIRPGTVSSRTLRGRS